MSFLVLSSDCCFFDNILKYFGFVFKKNRSVAIFNIIILKECAVKK